MKKFLCIFLILAFVACGSIFVFSGCDADQEEDYSMKVMTFNIRCIAIEDNLVNNWSNRRDQILQLIENYNADIIGFQELKEAQYIFLKENLKEEYAYYGEHRSSSLLSSEASAIFWKEDRFEALDKETFWLSETPDKISKGWDADLQRVCTRVTFKDRLNDKIFTHFNTHLDHKGSVARTEGIKLILDRIEQNAKPAILTGDFNFAENNERYEIITDQNLLDTKYAAPEENSDTGQTFNAFGKSSNTQPIDFIFTSQDFKTYSYQIIRDSDEDGNYPSDHFPVMAKIEFDS